MLPDTRTWVSAAIRKLENEESRRTETTLRSFPLPSEWGIDLYLKDESEHPTGSLKHRLAHSLLLFALINGDVGPETTLVEASSGSTAISEAYFARLLGLPFVAVIPARTSPAKIALIESYGGRCHLVNDPLAVYSEAERLGGQPDWAYLDQFTNASVVTDWRARNGLAGSLFEQLRDRRFPEANWIVVGAGTGGTSATLARYCRYAGLETRVAVVDPEGSAFYSAWAEGRRDVVASGSRIEGIGRPRVEPSFVAQLIDEVLPVPDAGSIAAMRLLAETTGLRAGGSTGTNLYGAFQLAARMRDSGESGSIVTLICDSGDRYLDAYYSERWITQQGLDVAPHAALLRHFLQTGEWVPVAAASPAVH